MYIYEDPYHLEEYLKGYDKIKSEKLLKEILKNDGKPTEWTLWELKLEHAFEILLKKPFTDFNHNVKYLIYFWADYEIYNDDVSIQQLLSPSPFESSAKHDNKTDELWYNRYNVDYNLSVFSFEEDYDNLPPSVLKECKKNKYSVSILGHKLAKIIQSNNLDFDQLIEKSNIHRRVVTDGSLFDAMKAATYTMSGEKSLLDTNHMAKYELDDEFENDEDWENLLNQVKDEKLRKHLLLLCQTHQASRCVGYEYYENDKYKEIGLREDEAETVAVWRSGEGQAETTVLQMKS